MYKYELAQEAGVSLKRISELCRQYEQDLIRLYPLYKRRNKMLPPVLVAFLKEKPISKEEREKLKKILDDMEV